MLRVINVRPFKATLKVKVSAAFRCPDRPYYYPGKREAEASASVMSCKNGSFHSQSLCFGKWYRAFIRSKRLLWQFISLKPKIMFPLALKYDYRVWHLSCDFHKTLCLFASRPWKGATVKRPMRFNLTIPNVFPTVLQKQHIAWICQV